MRIHRLHVMSSSHHSNASFLSLGLTSPYRSLQEELDVSTQSNMIYDMLVIMHTEVGYKVNHVERYELMGRNLSLFREISMVPQQVRSENAWLCLNEFKELLIHCFVGLLRGRELYD